MLDQWDVAVRLSNHSQIGKLVGSRSGGICHYCLPTGYQHGCDGDTYYVDAVAYAHRCMRCFTRHIVVGDRPMYALEPYHYKLLHRCQHVICSDRDKLRGILANITLTHSGLVDDPSLDRRHSCETYLSHAVRAELMVLGGNITFLPNPSGVSVTVPSREPGLTSWCVEIHTGRFTIDSLH